MPERGFASETWDGDEWFQDLNRDQRYLFIYLWTNNHCNQAGLYHITLTTMANETLFAKEELPGLLTSLEPKVTWYQADNLVWVKNFLKRQSKSSKFVQAAAKSLTAIRNQETIKSLLEYNYVKYSISIPYQYYTDKVSILTRDTDTDTVSNTGTGNLLERGVVKGGKPQSEDATPVSESEDDESLSPEDREVVDTWFSVKGIEISLSDASELVARLREEFTDVDILLESKAWAARKISEPLTENSRPSSQIWNWMLKAREIYSRGEKTSAKHRHKQDKDVKRNTYKECPDCEYKSIEHGGKTEATNCPDCGAVLRTDYTAGAYGSVVRR